MDNNHPDRSIGRAARRAPRDPVRVRTRRRCLAELARGRNTETYDIASPLYGLDGSSRATSEAEREAA
jgi:hypothetical protein